MASNILKISGPVQGFRRFASTATPSAQGHAGGGSFWKKLSLLIALPGVALCYVNAEIKEKEHHEHPRPEFKAYQHLRLRTKPYPWGDGNHTLFHNKALNPLPEGYED